MIVEDASEVAMSTTGCLSEQELRAYVVGELPERIGQRVADHLASCSSCELTVQRLDGLCDPALAALRRALQLDTAEELATTQTLDAETSAPPERVGNCLILEELGHGGMAIVYKARQERPERLVAVKLLLGGKLSGAERRARFSAEADAIARLHHPHIVQVYEAGEHGGLLYLVLEFCAGGTLAQRLNGTPQTAALAVQWLEPLAQAVAHAHKAGVIHRDLKPANVLLTADGQVKISDFGLARAERPELTATGAILGTPSYMPPEQAAGGKQVGPQADVYALGALLYEVLTGRPPFQGASAIETLAQVRDQEPVPPRRLQPSVPADLETVCLTCLQKTPARRYAGAAELADDLRRFREGRPILARPSGVVERSWRWCRRNPGWAAMVASLLALLLIVAVGSSVGALWLGQALGDAQANLVRAQQAERASEERLLEAQMAQARGISLSRRPGQRFASLAVLGDAIQRARKLDLLPEKSLELRNLAILALSLPDMHLVKQWDAIRPERLE
jgi:tRNA A-37 threonylcarbamoyl transferase component Bud32